MRRTVALTLLALAALAPSSDAQVTLAPGARPNVSVDDQGTAYIAWTGPGADSRQLFFCRLPRGARACAPLTQIPAGGDTVERPITIGSGTTVLVLSHRYGFSSGNFAGIYLYRSNDGGTTFDGGTEVGSIPMSDGIAGPGAAVSAITQAATGGTYYQRVPVDRGSVVGSSALLSATHPYEGTLGLVDANTPLAVFADGGGNAQFRRYSGAGDPNSEANWTPAVDIGVAGSPQLVSGPTGLFLIAGSGLTGGEMQVRRFNGAGFDAPVQVADASTAEHAVQDGSGRIHLVSPRFEPGQALFYGTSDDGRAWETRRIGLAEVPSQMRLDVAPDHLGVLVGTFATGSSTNTVWAFPIGPTAAQPVVARRVGATVVSGIVRVRRPGSRTFTPLVSGDVIPVGSLLDARRGRVRITIALPDGREQSSDFFDGVFRVAQSRGGLATMALAGGSFAGCPRARRGVAAAAKTIRKLWGDGRGRFRTKGRYATATIRGTRWYTADRCDGTLVRVTEGSVTVRDLAKRRTVVLRAGSRYLARR